MAGNMRELWGVAALPNSRQRKLPKYDEEQVKNLMEICGPELTRRGAKKLLADNRNDCTAALNVFMDMPQAQKTRINTTGPESDDEEEESAADISTLSASLPKGWTDFKTEIMSWVRCQCLALGCEVKFVSADPSPLPTVIPLEQQACPFTQVRKLLDSADSLSSMAGLQCLFDATLPDDEVGTLSLCRSFSGSELLGTKKSLDVQVRRGLVEALLKREKKVDEKLGPVENKILSVRDLRGTIDWRNGWHRGVCKGSETSLEKASKGVVVVKGRGTSESYMVPAAMLSFGACPTDVSEVRIAADGNSTKDVVVPHVVEAACSKVLIFDRVGDVVSSQWMKAVTDTLQNRFLDTNIFFKRIASGYRIAVCGLGAHWSRNWLLGRIVWPVAEGHGGLRSDAMEEIERKTGCSILLSPKALNKDMPDVPVWEWKDRSEWCPYSTEDSRALEEAYKSNQDTFKADINNTTYIFNLNEMTQTNVETENSRKMRRGGEDEAATGASMREVISRFTEGLESDIGMRMPGMAGLMGLSSDMWGNDIANLLSDDMGEDGELRDEDDDGDGEGEEEVEGDDGDGEEGDEEADGEQEGEDEISDFAEDEELRAAIALSKAEAEAQDAREAQEESHVEESETQEGEPHVDPALQDELAAALALSTQADVSDAVPEDDLGAALARALAQTEQVQPKKSESPEREAREQSPEPERKCKEGMVWAAVVGPHNTRKRAMDLLEKEREIREEMLRILPSMQGILHPAEVMERTKCKQVSPEGPGMIRLVGYPADINKARNALRKLIPKWQEAMQHKRLTEVTKELVSELSKIEVRVPISDRLRQLLSQPIGMHASGFIRKSAASLIEKYRSHRSESRGDAAADAGRVQVMWVTLDEFAMGITKKMKEHDVPVPKEWTPQGAALGVYIGDRVRNSAPFNATPATRKAVEGFNVPFYEEGTVSKLESWLNQEAQTQRQGLDVFLRTVEEWLKCTCEQRISDPGRPSLVALEVEWEVTRTRDSKGHFGMWRQDGLTVNNYWCSNPTHRDWPYCEHSGSVRTPHWSCCGEHNQGMRCSKVPVSENKIQPGTKVRVRDSVKIPKFKWGPVKHGDIGTVLKIDKESKDKCTVEFEASKKWNAYIPDLEIVPGNTQKGVLHNPALGFISKVGPPIKWDDISNKDSAQQMTARVTAKLVQQKWSLLADQYLLTELNRVLTASTDTSKDDRVSDLRAAHTTTQRARHRLREMEKDAEKISAQLIDCLYQVIRATKNVQGEDVSQIVALLEECLEIAQENLREWVQEINAADFDVERQLLKLRQILAQKEKFERRRRTVWDIIQHISEVSGAFIDYRPPNLHLRVKGNEVNIRAAMQQLKYLGDEGAQGLEKSVTVSVSQDISERLRKNSCVLLQLVEQQAGLHEASLTADGALKLVGTEEQVANAKQFLNIHDMAQVRSDEYAVPLASQATQDWGRQLSAIPVSDPRVCCVCLDDGDEGLYELLCGHPVHPVCLQRWVAACIERSKGATESGDMEGPGSVAVCPMTGGGGCTHVLTTREFCEAARGSDGDSAHATLDNLERHIRKRLPTHDKIRTCPQCSEWVVAGTKAEPVMCKACGHTFCAVRGMPRCGGTAHYFSSCDQFARARVKCMKKRGREVPAEVAAVGQMPDNCVPCRKCQSWIMREEDLGQRCRYMVCRECMYEFCWLCLIPAVNHKHVHSSDTRDRSKPPECDPDNRDERRKQLLEKMQEGEVVNVWDDCTSCSRCNKWPISKDETAFTCLQCPNVYLCSDCEEKGCVTDKEHVLDDIPRVQQTRGKPAQAVEIEDIPVDEAFWSDILPRDNEWECVECAVMCLGETCDSCGEHKPLAKPSKLLCTGGHVMGISGYAEEAYKTGWVCNDCEHSKTGERWFCGKCHDDYCFSCRPHDACPPKCLMDHNTRELRPPTRGNCCGPGCPVSFTPGTPRWICKPCSFELCNSCYKSQSTSVFPKRYLIHLIGIRNIT
eukprot:TRINITY_DN8231_c1_g2_i1.p1 TRINITY_DN8231_c1_g2~~TRINITY_DN8231_c1_g2_i1.p1  ORF type:complete len:1976 (+),score=370.69 TRINITY_DN8231_c1_g2_i1:54-5981(+)